MGKGIEKVGNGIKGKTLIKWACTKSFVSRVGQVEAQQAECFGLCPSSYSGVMRALYADFVIEVIY
jgi:hypothetical protein